MLKRLFLFLLVLCPIVLVSCSSPNEYGLAYNPDGSGDIEYIYYDDERVVYVVGGLMMAEIDGSPKMLEMALHEGDVTVEDILVAAEKDVENGDIEAVDYPDGSREYHYDHFTIVKLNTHLGNRDVYFVPANMSYYDVTNGGT